MPRSYTVIDDDHDSRLDKWFLQNVINLPHSLIEKIIRNNKIKLKLIEKKLNHPIEFKLEI